MMRVVAISRVLNEADVIESFVRHTSTFVSHHIFADNGSSDGTMEILAALKNEGLPLTVFQIEAVSINQADTFTLLYKEACLAHEPDWVLCADADEFINDKHVAGGLNHYLQQLLDSEDIPVCLKNVMVDFAATPHDDPNELVLPTRIRNRHQQQAGGFKVILRGGFGDRNIRITEGAHYAYLDEVQLAQFEVPGLSLAHYSVRSPYQYIVKFVRGWSKVLATGQSEVNKGTSRHYKDPFDRLRDTPERILRAEKFMEFKDEHVRLVEDPTEYLGGPLKYTQKTDEALRSVRCLMGFLQQLALRHGKLLDQFPEVRQTVQEWERDATKVL